VIGGKPGVQWPTNGWNGGGRARCNHCRTEFTFQELPAGLELDEPDDDDERDTTAPPTVCPACGGRFYVYSTKGATQYRKCRDCGNLDDNKTFKKT